LKEEKSMLMSTLPDLGVSRRYEVKGIVYGTVMLGLSGNANLERAFKDLEQQATNMGADAIIDIKITAPSGERVVAAVIGTAVKIIP
jgi:hypothetical protein